MNTDRVIFWANCLGVAGLVAMQTAEWISGGVRGRIWLALVLDAVLLFVIFCLVMAGKELYFKKKEV